MRKISDLLLLLTLFAPLVSPALGQDVYPSIEGRQTGGDQLTGSADQLQQNEEGRFANVEALADPTGVLIRWQMLVEGDIVGYFVYRLVDGERVRINEAMILGASSRAGSGNGAGEQYKLFDPAGGRNSVYLVEAVNLRGLQVHSGGIAVKNVRDLEQYTGESADILLGAARSKNRSVESTAMLLPEELQETVKSSNRVPNAENQRFIASQPGVRIAIRREGLYRVTRNELSAAGFDLSSPVENWRLFVAGNEEAIIVGPSGQYIDFYGKPIDTVESETQIYYLIGGAVPGKRIQQRAARSMSAISARSFESQIDRKERVSYVNNIFNGDAENYWGRIVIGTPTTAGSIGFNLPAIDTTAATATITIKMQGYSFTPHEVRPILNGVALVPFAGSNQSSFSATYEVASSSLINGSNSLQLGTGGNSDFSLFDSVSVRYMRRYVAEQNRLAFFTNGPRRVEVEGFGSPNVRVFDTTVEGAPTLVRNTAVVLNGGTYTALLPAGRPGVFYAVEDTGVLSPASVVENKPSSLASPLNGADLIIVSHSSADFMGASEAWADYRRGQGFSVKIVDITDVFDEFSYGVLTADAINSFLKNAYQTWGSAPKYVMLMGDSTFDSRNYEGFGYWNMVPTKMITTIYSETGSDEALADFDNDGLAEIAIGRIPMRNASDITTIFNKTKRFETPAMQALSRGALFAYDLSGGWDFEGMSETLRSELPAGVPTTMVSRATSGAQARLINELSTGKYIANYSGHGSTGLWAASSFFGLNNVSQLTNSDPTIFTMLTCLNGYFLTPLNDSLSDVLLKSQTGGAVVAWASSGETTADVQLIMAKRFYSQLVAGKLNRMGDLVKDAKTTLPDGRDVRLSWVLLGDPMLKVR